MKHTFFSPTERKVIFLSSLGGALEFYDFIIYVFFAAELGTLFFPKENQLASLLGVYAVFAIGYLVRPLGGILFSHFGDKYGRKKSFVITLILMALPTFLMGLLPTHATLGIGATILLVLLRLLQGLAVGGEIPGAITFAGEHVSPKHRGITCAVIFFGINLGLILGSVVSVLISIAFTKAQVLGWAWRLPFLFGGLLGIVSFFLRRQLSETPVFKAAHLLALKKRVPIIETFSQYPLQVLQGIAIISLEAVNTCLLFLYLPTYLTVVLHYPKTTINILNTLALILISVVFLWFAQLSDRYGRKIFLLIGSLGFVLLGYEFFYLLGQERLINVVIVLFVVSIIGAAVCGVCNCALIELFPTSVRYTGAAVCYNISFGFFGGLSPFIATSLIETTGNILSPSFYLIAIALICFLAALTIKNKHNQVLL